MKTKNTYTYFLFKTLVLFIKQSVGLFDILKCFKKIQINNFSLILLQVIKNSLINFYCICVHYININLAPKHSISLMYIFISLSFEMKCLQLLFPNELPLFANYFISLIGSLEPPLPTPFNISFFSKSKNRLLNVTSAIQSIIS